MKWWNRIATIDMLFIAVVTLILSFVGSWLKRFPGFSLLGALILALIFGMIVQFPIRSIYVKNSAKHAAGVKDAAGLISNKLLRLGIILLGFKLDLSGAVHPRRQVPAHRSRGRDLDHRGHLSVGSRVQG